MDATSLADRLAVMRDAVEAASEFRDRLHEASGDTLGELVTLADTFASMGAQVRAAVVAEAVRRGEVETTMSAWVGEHAPSLRQGGASQLARMVMEATKGGPTWTSQTHGPDPDSPTGIVWAAVQAVAPDLGREVDPEGGGEPDGIPADESTSVYDQPTATPLTAGNGLAVLSEMRVLEPQLRERVATRVSRGKLDLVLRLRSANGSDALQVDEALVAKLGDLARQLDAGFPQLRVQFTDLLQFPGVLQARGVDVDALQREAMVLLDAVLDDFVASREREGGKLAEVIGERATAIAAIAAEVRTLVPLIRTAQRTKLEARLVDLSQPADPGRVEQELVLWLQKLDVDEELDRLDSHLSELRRTLKQKEPVGRRLDFLLQEFNREANTLGSKSVDARTSNAAVELKVLIDQVREQIQNIE